MITAQTIITVVILYLHGTNLQRQTEQIDEAFCIVMVVQITGGEGSQVLIVQRVRTVSYTHLDVYKRQGNAFYISKIKCR